MTPLLIAVLLVGTLGIVNLLFTVGVAKRLREHAQLLSAAPAGNGAFAPAVGEQLDDFDTIDIDGQALNSNHIDSETLVAFLSPGCGPCSETLPKLVRQAGQTTGGRDRVLTVLAGDPEAAATMATELDPVSRVVVESASGPVSTAFRVRAFPTVLLIARQNGRLTVTADQVDRTWSAHAGTS